MANPICIDASFEDARDKMKPSHFIDPDTILEGEARERAHVFLTSADEKFVAGIWECSPCKEKVQGYPADEFMTVLSGRVIVSGDDGTSQSFGPGDSFVMQKGWSGVWHMTETFTKYFIMYLS